MNKNRWNRLPKDVQNAVMSVGGLEGSKFWGRHFFDNMKTQTLEKLKKSGQADHVYQLGDKERRRWVKVGGKPVWEEWVKTMQAKGHPKAREILDATLEILK
jgi:TRAP-type C4-dicarboxylate transport system substrate-binding protein